MAKWILIVTVFCLAPVSASVQADEEGGPIHRPGSSHFPYDEHTPGARHMQQAQRAYRANMHYSAYQNYRAGARWADKFAQFNVGVMYLRGEGADFNPARGWAWIKLSAERGYPQMVEMADDLYALLDDEQRRRGREIYEEELLPDFGDEMAVDRTADRMDRERRRATGTRTGSRAMMGALTVIDGSGQRRSGDEFYAPDKWDFERIIRFEREFMFRWAAGRVTIGETELIDDDAED